MPRSFPCLTSGRWPIAILLGASITLFGCDTGDNDDNDSTGDVNLSANMSSASLLIANEEAIAENRSAVSQRNHSDSANLFSYRLRGEGIQARNGGSDGATTNMLAVDEDGNTTLAIESDLPLHVMYSLQSKDGDKVFLALATDSDDNYNVENAIAQMNCAILSVDLTTDEISCVAEGFAIRQMMDDQYMKMVSGNQKPMQLDDEGNLYFLGQTFEVEGEDDWGWIEFGDWRPRLYRVNTSGNEEPVALTQDNEYVDFFVSLADGSVVFQAINEIFSETELTMLRDNTRVDLLGQGWGVDFFTLDDHQTVIFGQESGDSGQNGVRFARPDPNVSDRALRSSLDTRLFTTSGNSEHQNNDPKRILISDNGSIYAVFSGSRSYRDENDDWRDENSLSVYQLLPFDPTPKLELELDEGQDWWDWMGRTPFQVVGDYLFYRGSVEVPGFGNADEIYMLHLPTREVTPLLSPSLDSTYRMQLYNWRVAGGSLHFAGLNRASNNVVRGEINVSRVNDGASVGDYLEMAEVASASGAASMVSDIELIRRVDQGVQDFVAPTVDIEVDPSNIYSLSLAFDKPMNKQSVEDSVVLREGNNSPIDMMPVWINRSLHLIPDQLDRGNSTGLLHSGTKPLEYDTTYNLDFSSGAVDVFGEPLDRPDIRNFTTRPEHGWYLDKNADLAAYLGPDRDGDRWSYAEESFELLSAEDDELDHLFIEFEARNRSYSGVDITVRHKHDDQGRWNNRLASVYVSDWVSWSYNHGWDSTNESGIMNGQWQTYRIEYFGDTFSLLRKPDGADDFIEVFSENDRSDNGKAVKSVRFDLSEAMDFRRITIGKLEENGSETHGSLVRNWDFTKGDPIPGELNSPAYTLD